MLRENNSIILSGHQYCQCCNKQFGTHDFGDKILKGNGYDIFVHWSEIEKLLGLSDYLLNEDPDGQWFIFNNDFICPHCVKKLIEEGKAKICTEYHEYFTTEIHNKEYPFATLHNWRPYIDKDPSGFDVKIPYNVLRKIISRKINK